MHAAASRADCTVVVLSQEYLRSAYCAAEWAAAFVGDPAATERRLIPVRVEPCRPTGLLAGLVYVDLVGSDEATARAQVRDAIDRRRAKPERVPLYPSELEGPSTRQFPGASSDTVQSDPLNEALAWYAMGGPREIELATTLGVEADVEEIRARWVANESQPITTPVGVDYLGDVLNLQLARDGPLGVVLGRSGSGTSEVLCTLVLSSALHVSPRRLRFHLLDFKGGAVWYSINKIPHVRTLLSLETDDAMRTFEALVDDLLREKSARLRELGEAAVTGDVLGRQVPWDWFLVDEAHADPQLQDALVRVQQVGRRLGVAVTVATQREAWLWHRVLAFERYRIVLSHHDRDALPPELAERLEQGSGGRLLSVPPGRGLAVFRGTDVVPFQAFKIGRWEQYGDSPYPANRALDTLVDAVCAAVQDDG